MKSASILLSSIFAGATLLLAACGGAVPIRFYTLASEVPTSVSQPQTEAAQQRYIDVQPLSVPERLMRSQLVLRRSETEVTLLEQQRWASPFPIELREALATRIAAKLGAIDISQTRQLVGKSAQRIKIAFIQLEAMPDRHIDAVFSWAVNGGEGGVSLNCQAQIHEPVGAGVAALVEGMRRVTMQAAEKISDAILTGHCEESLSKKAV